MWYNIIVNKKVIDYKKRVKIMRELNLQKDEMIFECTACGTFVAYTDEDTTIEETYGGDKVKCIQCPHCGRMEQLFFLS